LGAYSWSGLAQEETFVPEKGYTDYITNLDGLRGRIVAAIPLEPRMRVLDAAAGPAWFSAELAKRDPTLKIVAIDTSDRMVKAADRRIREKWLDSSITTMKMDATLLDFQPSTFSLVTNLSGLNRVHMTHSAQGVRQSIHEAARVLKPRGYMCFTIIPPEEAETTAQRLECETYSYACGLTWLPAIKYQEYLRGAGFSLVKRETFYTGKKLDAAQARQHLESMIEKAKFLEVEALPLDEVWKRYGVEIEKEGLGHFSRVVLMIARKNA
jgi:ubiquinone/menaquinone biosynthesis C-methylase UbiE